MQPFSLHRPESVEEAIGVLMREGEAARTFSGGTELILLLKQRFATCEHLVDLKGVASLQRLEIRETDGALVIGAGVTHRVLERSPLVRERFPLLAEVEGKIANVRVRNVGTLAGNLAFAEPHSDPATLLMGWGAALRLRGPSGVREVPAAEFFRGAFETALEPGELIEEIVVPSLQDGWRGGYMKFGIRERPSLGVCVFLRLEGSGEGVGKKVAEARLVVGCVEPCARRIPEAEEVFLGVSTEDLERAVAEVGRRTSAAVDPVSDLHGSEAYKRAMAGELMSRTIYRLLGGDGTGS